MVQEADLDLFCKSQATIIASSILHYKYKYWQTLEISWRRLIFHTQCHCHATFATWYISIPLHCHYTLPCYISFAHLQYFTFARHELDFLCLVTNRKIKWFCYLQSFVLFCESKIEKSILRIFSRALFSTDPKCLICFSSTFAWLAQYVLSWMVPFRSKYVNTLSDICSPLFYFFLSRQISTILPCIPPIYAPCIFSHVIYLTVQIRLKTTLYPPEQLPPL